MSAWAWVGLVVYALGVLGTVGVGIGLRGQCAKEGKPNGTVLNVLVGAVLWPVMLPVGIGRALGEYAGKSKP